MLLRLRRGSHVLWKRPGKGGVRSAKRARSRCHVVHASEMSAPVQCRKPRGRAASRWLGMRCAAARQERKRCSEEMLRYGGALLWRVVCAAELRIEGTRHSRTASAPGVNLSSGRQRTVWQQFQSWQRAERSEAEANNRDCRREGVMVELMGREEKGEGRNGETR